MINPIMSELEFKVHAAYGKCRNIIYYKSIDTRPRAVYFHVLRNYRSELKEIIDAKPDFITWSLLNQLYSAIPPKVTEGQVDEVILKLKTILDDYE